MYACRLTYTYAPPSRDQEKKNALIITGEGMLPSARQVARKLLYHPLELTPETRRGSPQTHDFPGDEEEIYSTLGNLRRVCVRADECIGVAPWSRPCRCATNCAARPQVRMDKPPGNYKPPRLKGPMKWFGQPGQARATYVRESTALPSQ